MLHRDILGSIPWRKRLAVIAAAMSLGISVLASSTLCFVLALDAASNIGQQTVVRAAASLEKVSSASAWALKMQDSGLTRSILADLLSAGGMARVDVVAEDGVVIFTSAQAPVVQGRCWAGELAHDLWVVDQALVAGAEPVGALRAHLDCLQVEQHFAIAFRQMWGISVLSSILLALLLYGLFQFSIVRPLSEIWRQVSLIDPARPGTGFAIGMVGIPGEITALSARINAMLDAIRSANLEKEKAKASLAKSQERLHLALLNSNAAAWDIDLRTGVHWYSREFLEMVGDPRAAAGDLVEQTSALLDDILRGGHVAEPEKARHAAMPPYGSDGDFAAEIRICRRGEDMLHWAEIRGRILQDSERSPTRMVGTLMLIDERKRTEETLRLLATTDSLTGLPNRAVAMENLAGAVGRGLGVAVMYIDMNRFKLLNDSLGHPAGDALLVAMAERARRVFRPSDTFARVGGDEFLAIVEGVADRLSAEHLVRTWAAVMSEPVNLIGTRYTAQAAIGVALYPDDGETPEALLRAADTAMYQHKRTGTGPFAFYDARMAQNVARRLHVEQELMRQLQVGGLRLYLQPKADARTGRLLGFEALARWPDASVTTSEFIEVAEEAGLIGAVGEWAVSEALGFVRQLQQATLWPAGARIGVNISAKQLLDPMLPDRVLSLLVDAGLSAKHLQFEVTETAILGDIDIAKETLLQLKGMGASIAIDDFGTGYSSLAYLHQLPIDELKLDGTFVRHLPGAADDRVIPDAVVKLGHALGMKVTAEGVETDASWQWLKSQGFDIIQGYHYAKPMPIEDIRLFIQNQPFIPA